MNNSWNNAPRGLKIIIAVLLTLALFIGILNLIPPGQVTDANPFLKKDTLSA